MRRFLIPVVLLSALIALFAAACSAEPEVIVEEKIVEVEKEVVKEVEVEVEKVVEKEVVVEVEKLVEVEVETEKILVFYTQKPDVGTSGPQSGGDLKIVSQGSISTIDPVFSLFYVVNAVASQMYEGLYGWDGNLEAQPRTAESFTTNADGTEYTFTIRDGIKFSLTVPILIRPMQSLLLRGGEMQEHLQLVSYADSLMTKPYKW
ncbi:MAG: hypothetical protein CM1200mP8_3410 [Chloroflexota bacterium]|nr:MAG: hypothetical protein CM1200mP8_3410 [Chloroflexota bacterium]